MKVELQEYDHSFRISLVPETVSETAKIIRLTTNTDPEEDGVIINTTSLKNGHVSGNLIFVKNKYEREDVR